VIHPLRRVSTTAAMSASSMDGLQKGRKAWVELELLLEFMIALWYPNQGSFRRFNTILRLKKDVITLWMQLNIPLHQESCSK